MCWGTGDLGGDPRPFCCSVPGESVQDALSRDSDDAPDFAGRRRAPIDQRRWSETVRRQFRVGSRLPRRGAIVSLGAAARTSERPRCPLGVRGCSVGLPGYGHHHAASHPVHPRATRYTPANTFVDRRGVRRCRQCQRESRRGGYGTSHTARPRAAPAAGGPAIQLHTPGWGPGSAAEPDVPGVPEGQAGSSAQLTP